MKLKSHKDLLVWQKSMILVKEVYAITRAFPVNEQFGMASQMQRAVVAIPSNISEGYGRQHRKEFIQFISIAQGSACELETQLIICNDIGLSSSEEISKCLSQLEEVQKMLRSLSQSLMLKTKQEQS